jgi:hypothetical protein
MPQLKAMPKLKAGHAQAEGSSPAQPYPEPSPPGASLTYTAHQAWPPCRSKPAMRSPAACPAQPRAQPG